jgi:hypothetical protein
MKQHKREANVRQAKIKLMDCLMGLRDELTQGEFLRVVTEELADAWSMAAKYMIREERHPGQPNKPGGLE